YPYSTLFRSGFSDTPIIATYGARVSSPTHEVFPSTSLPKTVFKSSVGTLNKSISDLTSSVPCRFCQTVLFEARNLTDSGFSPEILRFTVPPSASSHVNFLSTFLPSSSNTPTNNRLNPNVCIIYFLLGIKKEHVIQRALLCNICFLVFLN